MGALASARSLSRSPSRSLSLSPSPLPFVERYLSPAAMQNDAGEVVDLYLPRKCSATNNIIASSDHALVQIEIAKVDPETGVINGEVETIAICGGVRSGGESDDSINMLAQKAGILHEVFEAR